MLIPTHVDVLLPHKPYANYVLIGLISLISIIFFFIEISETTFSYFFNSRESFVSAYFFSAFVHADIFHLGGNMLFQWIFGNAICSKIGNGRYTLLYFICALGSSLAHISLTNVPSIGASGAINGIIGFYFVVYPRNYIYVFYWFFGGVYGNTRLPGFYMILMWFGFDIWGIMSGEGMVAYGAHLGGFCTGFIIAAILVKKKLIHFHKIDREHLFEKYFGRFNLDEVTSEMLMACKYLGEKEFTVRLRHMEEVSYPSVIIGRLLYTNKARGDDEIFNPYTEEWETMVSFWGDLAQTPQVQSYIKNQNQEAFKDENPKRYFLHKDGVNIGPYTVKDFKNMVESGAVMEESLIMTENQQEWLKVKDILVHAH